MHASHRSTSRQQRLFSVLRFALGVGCMVGLIVWFTDWPLLWTAFRGVAPSYMLGCVLIYFIGVWLSCLKWQVLLKVQGVDASLWHLIGWYLAGTFAGTFLPSDVGGDLGRGYLAGRVYKDKAKAALWSSIVAERLTGLAGLVILAAIVLVIAPGLLAWPAWLPVLIFGSALLAGALGLKLLGTLRLPQRLQRLVASLRDIIARYRRQRAVLFYCLVLSLLYHCLTAFSLWLILLSLDQQAQWNAALVSPLVGLVGLLPLTPGGLGVREGILTVLLQQSGVAGPTAVAASLLSRALLILTAFSGLPMLLGEMRRTSLPRPETSTNDADESDP